MQRRQFMTTALAALGATASGARAQPASSPLRIVFPFAVGGGGDALCRLLAEHAAGSLGRSVIVENKTGADGRIGIQFVKSAPADGDTILVTTGPTMSIMQQVHKAPGYDPFKDFEPVAHLANLEFCFAVAKSLPITSMAELAAWLKANPDKATYGIPGAGTIPHFIGLQFARLIGVDLRRLAYRGGTPALQDLVGGQIPMVSGTVADALAQHQAGTIRIIATSGNERSPFLPGLPTFTEAGFAITGTSWYGAWVPAGTPPAVIARLGASFAAVLRDAAIKDRMLKLGLIATGFPAAELARIQRADAERWAPTIKESGFTME